MWAELLPHTHTHTLTPTPTHAPGVGKVLADLENLAFDTFPLILSGSSARGRKVRLRLIKVEIKKICCTTSHCPDWSGQSFSRRVGKDLPDTRFGGVLGGKINYASLFSVLAIRNKNAGDGGRGKRCDLRGFRTNDSNAVDAVVVVVAVIVVVVCHPFNSDTLQYLQSTGAGTSWLRIKTAAYTHTWTCPRFLGGFGMGLLHSLNGGTKKRSHHARFCSMHRWWTSVARPASWVAPNGAPTRTAPCRSHPRSRTSTCPWRFIEPPHRWTRARPNSYESSTTKWERNVFVVVDNSARSRLYNTRGVGWLWGGWRKTCSELSLKMQGLEMMSKAGWTNDGG